MGMRGEEPYKSLGKYTGSLADQLLRSGLEDSVLVRMINNLPDASLSVKTPASRNPLTLAELQARSLSGSEKTIPRGSYRTDTPPPANYPLEEHINYAITCALRNGGVLDTDLAFPFGILLPKSLLCRNICHSYIMHAIHCMLLRKICMKDIARMLSLPISTAYRWRREMFRRMVEAIETAKQDAKRRETEAIIDFLKEMFPKPAQKHNI